MLGCMKLMLSISPSSYCSHFSSLIDIDLANFANARLVWAKLEVLNVQDLTTAYSEALRISQWESGV